MTRTFRSSVVVASIFLLVPAAWAISPPLARVAGLHLGGGGDVHCVVTVSPYAYAGHSNGKLYVISIANPVQPAVVAELTVGSPVTSLAVAGTRLIAGTDANASGPELAVINIANPLLPSLVGTLELGAKVHDVAVAGQYAYVGTASDGSTGTLREFHVVTLQDPANPLEVGGIDTSAIDRNSFSILSIAVAGNHAYVGRGAGYDNRQAFSVIDIANPTSPAIVASLGVSGAISGTGVSLFGDYAYVGIYDGADQVDFAIIDVSNPLLPATVQTFLLGARGTASFAFGQYVLSGSALSAQPPSRGLTLFEVSRPENALALESVVIGAIITDIAVTNDHAFVTSWRSTLGNFQVIDVAAVTTPDVTPPTVSVRSPYQAALSGRIVLSALASDDIRVAEVQFRVGTTNIGAPTTTADLVSPFTLEWDTTTIADGMHVISAVATDTSGNLATSSGLTVQVANAAGDRIPPSVAVSLPASSALLANAVLVKATASDNFQVASVQFQIDGAPLKAPVTTPPYVVAWDTTGANNGPHTITALATDAAGNQSVANGVTVTVDNRRQWVSTFSPLREFYVAPAGTGSGGSAADPMSLSTALGQATAGDLYWLTTGTYQANPAVTLGRAGTAVHPIVWRAARGARAHFVGGVALTAEHNWLWGVEVSNPPLSPDASGILLSANHVRAINNIIHDVSGAAIGTPNGFEGIVSYGNVLYGGTETPGVPRGHLVYPQNSFAEHGYKHFVKNIFIDAPHGTCNLSSGSGQDCFLFHAYTTAGAIQGMHLEGNIFAKGRFLIGGFGIPADREVVKGNAFYDCQPEFGYRRPTQVEFTNNYVGRGSVLASWWWGEGEVNYVQHAPNLFRGNEIYASSGRVLNVRTSAYTASGRQEGVTAISKADELDGNIYAQPFSAVIAANGMTANATSLAAWQTATASAGRTFDANSQVVSFPTASKAVVFQNEYETGRAHLALYNWALAATVSVDLSGALTNGAQYTIHDAKDAFGTPRLSGTYDGSSVAIPTGGAEFLALILTSTNSAVVCTVTGSDDNCNGLDEDCDGTIDGNFLPLSTQCGQGACARTGSSSCQGGLVEDTCAPGVPLAAEDSTCDGVDDDCNGLTDDGYVPEVTTCGPADCASSGVTACVAGVVSDSCRPKEASACEVVVDQPTPQPTPKPGCGCSSGPGSLAAWALWLGGAALLRWRRARRAGAGGR